MNSRDEVIAKLKEFLSEIPYTIEPNSEEPERRVEVYIDLDQLPTPSRADLALSLRSILHSTPFHVEHFVEYSKHRVVYDIFIPSV